MSAAAKYSQTQAEFEKEIESNNESYSYQSTYAADENRPYTYASDGFEPLGNARYSDGLRDAMIDAAELKGKDRDVVYAADRLENTGRDEFSGLKEEVRIVQGEQDRNDALIEEYDDYDDIVSF